MTLLIPILVFIALAVGLTWYFLAHDHGEKEPIGALWAAFGFGFLGAVAASFIEQLFISQDPATLSPGVSLFRMAMLIGVTEEVCKFLPLALFIYKRRYFNEHLDGVIYFGLAGLGFGLIENILYSLSFGLKAGLTRIIMTPFFHVATTALVGYFLIKVKLDHKPKWQAVLALVLAIVLHGLYDYGLFSGQDILVVLSLMITLGMTAFLFVLYMRASELDQAMGLSVVGKNSFCRSCGYPNPSHNLYCQRCGQRA